MMALYNFLTGKGQLITLLLAIVCVAIVMVSIFTGIGGAGYDVNTDLVAILKDADSTEKFNFFNAAIVVPIILILLASAALIFFGVMAIFTNPKGSIKIIISAGAILILFFLFYSLSESETTGKLFGLIQKNDIGIGTSKLISGGIKTSVLLIVVSFITAAGGEIYNIFK